MRNCPKCGLLIGQGTMGTVTPLCQCGWNTQPVLVNLPDTVDYIKQLEAAKQRELELLSVIENIKEAIDKADIPRGMLAIRGAFKIEPSQALREH